MLHLLYFYILQLTQINYDVANYMECYIWLSYIWFKYDIAEIQFTYKPASRSFFICMSQLTPFIYHWLNVQD